MTRIAILLFGLLAYAFFFAVFLYLVAFTGNLQATALGQAWPMLATLVPRSVDFGGAATPGMTAVLVNLGLVLLFGLQHSAMARLGFKARLKRHLPAAAERSVYVLLASAVLALLFWQWRPIPDVLWAASSQAGQVLGWAVFVGGFALVLASTFLIDHFDLFGLRQVWQQFVGRPATGHAFVTPLLYRLVRHPLYLGFILALWGGPVMTVGHALFAGALTVYILIAIPMEERDLVHQLGDRYLRYRREVPMLVPGLARPFDETRAQVRGDGKA